jgi:nucleoside-diphosphate-sugar epimerase
MRIAVTGATGFIGRHLVRALLDRGHSVLAVARNPANISKFTWHSQVKLIICDVYACELSCAQQIAECDAVIHLVWAGLPNYAELFHIDVNYPKDYSFLKTLIELGAKQLLVTGTCLEYGMKNGCLDESIPAEPTTPYGTAKDFLRRSLQALSEKHCFRLQWARLFYMYGSGQNRQSLMALLLEAIQRKDPEFNMSGGEQLRDFLPVTEVAELLVSLVENTRASGIFNICSGKPISVRNLVEAKLREERSELKLNFGYYPYPSHEPLAFWGNRQKLDDTLLKQ